MDMLVDIAVPLVVILMMVVVGMELTPENFRYFLACPRPVFAATAGQLLVLPLIAFGLALNLIHRIPILVANTMNF